MPRPWVYLTSFDLVLHSDSSAAVAIKGIQIQTLGDCAKLLLSLPYIYNPSTCVFFYCRSHLSLIPIKELSSFRYAIHNCSFVVGRLERCVCSPNGMFPSWSGKSFFLIPPSPKTLARPLSCRLTTHISSIFQAAWKRVPQQG